jgi:hypothetical protein
VDGVAWRALHHLQGPLLVCEMALRRWWVRGKLRPLPVLVARALTYAVLLALAGPLFFGPVEHDTDTAPRVIASVIALFTAWGKAAAQLAGAHPLTLRVAQALQRQLQAA